MAIHLKLNAIVAAMNGASNRLIEVEAFTEKELAALTEENTFTPVASSLCSSF